MKKVISIMAVAAFLFSATTYAQDAVKQEKKEEKTEKKCDKKKSCCAKKAEKKA